LRNRDATIQAVLESAQRLFSAKGYDRTSLVDIAAETGLSPRGVILHFSSKADIVAADYDLSLNRHNEVVHEEVQLLGVLGRDHLGDDRLGRARAALDS